MVEDFEAQDRPSDRSRAIFENVTGPRISIANFPTPQSQELLRVLEFDVVLDRSMPRDAIDLVSSTDRVRITGLGT